MLYVAVLPLRLRFRCEGANIWSESPVWEMQLCSSRRLCVVTVQRLQRRQLYIARQLSQLDGCRRRQDITCSDEPTGLTMQQEISSVEVRFQGLHIKVCPSVWQLDDCQFALQTSFNRFFIPGTSRPLLGKVRMVAGMLISNDCAWAHISAKFLNEH